jgi:hypothetical protein
MASYLLFEEFHLSLRVPRSLKKAEANAIHRVLEGARFRADLRRAVRAFLAHYPELKRVRLRLAI